MNTNQVS